MAVGGIYPGSGFGIAKELSVFVWGRVRGGDAISNAKSDGGSHQCSQSHAQCIANQGTQCLAECAPYCKAFGKPISVAHILTIGVAERCSHPHAQLGTVFGAHRIDTATHVGTIGSALIVAHFTAQ